MPPWPRWATQVLDEGQRARRRSRSRPGGGRRRGRAGRPRLQDASARLPSMSWARPSWISRGATPRERSATNAWVSSWRRVSSMLGAEGGREPADRDPHAAVEGVVLAARPGRGPGGVVVALARQQDHRDRRRRLVVEGPGERRVVAVEDPQDLAPDVLRAPPRRSGRGSGRAAPRRGAPSEPCVAADARQQGPALRVRGAGRGRRRGSRPPRASGPAARGRRPGPGRPRRPRERGPGRPGRPAPRPASRRSSSQPAQSRAGAGSGATLRPLGRAARPRRSACRRSCAAARSTRLQEPAAVPGSGRRAPRPRGGRRATERPSGGAGRAGRGLGRRRRSPRRERRASGRGGGRSVGDRGGGDRSGAARRRRRDGGAGRRGDRRRGVGAQRDAARRRATSASPRSDEGGATGGSGVGAGSRAERPRRERPSRGSPRSAGHSGPGDVGRAAAGAVHRLGRVPPAHGAPILAG